MTRTRTRTPGILSQSSRTPSETGTKTMSVWTAAVLECSPMCVFSADIPSIHTGVSFHLDLKNRVHTRKLLALPLVVGGRSDGDCIWLCLPTREGVSTYYSYSCVFSDCFNRGRLPPAMNSREPLQEPTPNEILSRHPRPTVVIKHPAVDATLRNPARLACSLYRLSHNAL